MSNPQTIVGLELLPSGKFLVSDWQGKKVEVALEDFASHCQGLLNDPNLPDVEVLNPGHANLVEAGTRFLLPESLQPYSGPITQIAELLWKQATAPSPRRQRPPEPPPPPPSPPRDQARAEPDGRSRPRSNPHRPSPMARRRRGMVG